MEETAANQIHEEELSFREELLEDLSSRDALLIVVPLVFNLSLTTVSGYFEKYINRYVFLFLAIALLWSIIFFLKPKEIARIKFKILLFGIGFYILTASAFNWIWFTVFDSEKVSDNISSQFLIIFVNAASFLLVWLGFHFIQKLTKP